MSKKVYVVSSGEYSDYHIDGIFSSEIKAKKYIDEFNKYNKSDFDKMEINPWELDNDDNFPVTIIEITFEGLAKCYKIEFPGIVGFIGWGGKNKLSLFWAVKTTDEKRAIKVANEKRAQIIALGLWGREIWENGKQTKEGKKLKELGGG